ncbi:MAG: rod shape-determining protein MreC [Clostridium sp.]|nr:rod shape-determining protein MreC [Clostridium sp.]
MKDFLRQNGILLLVAAVLLSVALSLGSAVFGGTDPVSNAVNAVATPFRTGVSAVLDWFGGVRDYVLHYDQLHEELDALRARVAELEDEVRQNEEAAKENEKLRELLDLQQKRSDFSFQSARVSERSTSNWSNTLTLSRGSDAGLEVGDCVVTETGALVGVLSEVGVNWSTVSTVINTTTELGGIVNRTYSAGVLEGDFTLMGQGKLKLSYLSDSAQLVSGDEVLTSGKGGVYPSGLVVGTVDGVFTDPSGINRYAVVTPTAALADLTEVFIITDFDIVE